MVKHSPRSPCEAHGGVTLQERATHLSIGSPGAPMAILIAENVK